MKHMRKHCYIYTELRRKTQIFVGKAYGHIRKCTICRHLSCQHAPDLINHGSTKHNILHAYLNTCKNCKAQKHSPRLSTADALFKPITTDFVLKATPARTSCLKWYVKELGFKSLTFNITDPILTHEPKKPANATVVDIDCICTLGLNQ